MVIKKKIKTKPKSKKKPIKKPKPTAPAKMGRPKEWTADAIEFVRLELEKWIENPKNYFFTGFLNQMKLGPEQIERFANENKDFCESYARAKRIQEERLVELAVSRKGDGNFIKFILQNKSGWKEKSEVSGDAANPLAVIMERIGQSSQDLLDYDDE